MAVTISRGRKSYDMKVVQLRCQGSITSLNGDVMRVREPQGLMSVLWVTEPVGVERHFAGFGLLQCHMMVCCISPIRAGSGWHDCRQSMLLLARLRALVAMQQAQSKPGPVTPEGKAQYVAKYSNLDFATMLHHHLKYSQAAQDGWQVSAWSPQQLAFGETVIPFHTVTLTTGCTRHN